MRGVQADPAQRKRQDDANRARHQDDAEDLHGGITSEARSWAVHKVEGPSNKLWRARSRQYRSRVLQAHSTY